MYRKIFSEKLLYCKFHWKPMSHFFICKWCDQDQETNRRQSHMCEACMTTYSMLFPFLCTRCIAGKKKKHSHNLDGILHRVQAEFNHSAAALHCQCSFCKVGPWPFWGNCSGIHYNQGKLWKTLIGTAQRGRLWSWSLFSTETSGPVVGLGKLIWAEGWDRILLISHHSSPVWMLNHLDATPLIC